ncbi:hypothetical protein Bca4012_024789 [Brassica carinata]
MGHKCVLKPVWQSHQKFVNRKRIPRGREFLNSLGKLRSKFKTKGRAVMGIELGHSLYAKLTIAGLLDGAYILVKFCTVSLDSNTI